MSFRFLGKKPPQKYKHYAKGATEEEYIPNDKELSAHFRGALKEASDEIQKVFHECRPNNKNCKICILVEHLRVSAGDEKE